MDKPVYEFFFDGSQASSTFQFVTTPIRARARPRRSESPSFVVLRDYVGVSDAGGPGYIAEGKLEAYEKELAAGQTAVSFRLRTTDKATKDDVRAIATAAELPLTVELKTAADFQLGVGPAPVLLALPDPSRPRTLQHRFKASLKPSVTIPDLIRWRMWPVVRHKMDEGYTVANPDPASGSARKHLGSDPKAGFCGDFRDWGAQWSLPFLTELFGDDYLLRWIHVGYPGAELALNHVANLLILGDGSQYVLDYWLSVMTKRPCVYDSREEWRSVATQMVFELAPFRPNPSVLKFYYAEDMEVLASFVTEYGQEEGIRRYLSGPTGATSDPDAVRARRAELVRSYRKAPW